MASEDDIRDVFLYLRSARVHKAPHPGDIDVVRAYADALRNVRSDVVLQAGRSWVQDPDSGRYWPTAADLLHLAMAIEAQERHEVRDIVRGCACCGEIINEEGRVIEHGSGFRHFIQHCHPLNDEGDVDFDAEPYRIGSRLVLCDCTKGKQIAAAHELEMNREMPKGQISSRPANWRPTLTLEKAWKVFHRADARIYVTGSHARLIAEDRRPESPFFTRPSPEETMKDWTEARRQRMSMYEAMRGNVSDASKAFLYKAGIAMGEQC